MKHEERKPSMFPDKWDHGWSWLWIGAPATCIPCRAHCVTPAAGTPAQTRQTPQRKKSLSHRFPFPQHLAKALHDRPVLPKKLVAVTMKVPVLSSVMTAAVLELFLFLDRKTFSGISQGFPPSERDSAFAARVFCQICLPFGRVIPPAGRLEVLLSSSPNGSKLCPASLRAALYFL